jgi:hypothetical protein
MINISLLRDKHHFKVTLGFSILNKNKIIIIMKIYPIHITLIFLIAVFSSCGISHSVILNANQNSTQVNLGSNNYKVVEEVSGTSEAKYICLIGGLKKKQLFQNAYSDMMKKANLMNGSRAVVNLVTEEHLGGFPPFYYKRTVSVSSHVIEFTK